MDNVKDPLVKKRDFRNITDDSKAIETTVYLIRGYGKAVEWTTLGSYDLHKRDNLYYWDFSASYKNVFSHAHSRSSVFRIQLVGVEFQNFRGCLPLAVNAWICPTGPEDFRFPPDDYKNETYKCDWKDCRGKSAIGDYLPPENDALYEAIRDMRVEIRSYVK